jgi:hypothetical protein
MDMEGSEPSATAAFPNDPYEPKSKLLHSMDKEDLELVRDYIRKLF